MNMTKSPLLTHPFFQDIGEEQLETVARQALEVQFDPGDLIFREGEAAYDFYLICEGQVALESRLIGEERIPIAVVGPGEVLGWSSLFAPHSLHFYAKTLSPTKAIFLDGARLITACDKDPALGYSLMKRLADVLIKRLVATQQQMALQARRAGRKTQAPATSIIRRSSWTLARPISG